MLDRSDVRVSRVRKDGGIELDIKGKPHFSDFFRGDCTEMLLEILLSFYEEEYHGTKYVNVFEANIDFIGNNQVKASSIEQGTRTEDIMSVQDFLYCCSLYVHEDIKAKQNIS